MSVHVLAIATAVAAFLLIVVGGLVHGTGSGLACPDWPTCYGSLLPPMEGGVLYEHGHRLIAGVVVLLSLALALSMSVSKLPEQRGRRHLAWVAFGLVLSQAVLGGITVLLRLPTTASTLHTAVSLLFFVTIVTLAVRTRPVATAPAPATLSPAAARVALASAVAVYFQMVLGGLVRHSGAGLACVDFPLCRGAFWPADAHPVVLVHIVHRLMAVAVALFVVVSSVISLRSARRARGGRAALVRAAAIASVLLVGAEIWVGIRSVQSLLDLATVQAHLVLAVALLTTQLLVATVGRGTVAPASGGISWIRDVITLAKPRITGMVVITFAGSMWLAPGELARWRMIMAAFGTALIVAGANALNMLIERDIDLLMERTRGRPLPQSRLSPETAAAFATAVICAALPLLFLAANPLTGILGLIAMISYVAVYTPMKRVSPVALFVGAVPGAIPPMMGWVAVTGKLQAPALVLFAILFLWQIPHFLAIAIYRAADYARAGFKVLPNAVSALTTRIIIVAFSVVLVTATILLHPLRVAGPRYTVVAGLLGVLLIGWGLAGFRPAAARPWARSLFLFSVLYLTLLFVALAFDRTVA